MSHNILNLKDKVVELLIEAKAKINVAAFISAKAEREYVTRSSEIELTNMIDNLILDVEK